MNIKQLGILLLTLITTAQANAHSRWLLPSHFTLSSDKGEWIMLDATASNEVFNVDKALSIDNLRILAPSGKSERPSSLYKGHRKSIADYFVDKSGTYKITNNGSPMYFSSYEVAGERKRARLNKVELAQQLPPSATKAKTSYGYARIESYITMNNPSDNYATENKFLELVPVTHPSEIVENESATFKFIYNGKPQQGVKVEITQDGARYRNSPETLKLTSNKNGEVQITLTKAGRYLLIAEHQQKAENTTLADNEFGSVFLTFEAQLN